MLLSAPIDKVRNSLLLTLTIRKNQTSFSQGYRLICISKTWNASREEHFLEPQ